MAEIFIGNKVDDPPKIAGRYTKHKNNVLKYIFFESPIKINNDYYTVYLDTQRVKNQDPTLLDLYNIRVKKNVLTGTNLIAFPQGQVNNSGILPNLSTIYLQTVYHGSGANFERFNTEQYVLSGEGSMSFGYGTYLTGSEEIARDYAERNRKKIEKNADNPFERGTLEREIFEDLRSFDFDKTKYKDYLVDDPPKIAGRYTDIKKGLLKSNPTQHGFSLDLPLADFIIASYTDLSSKNVTKSLTYSGHKLQGRTGLYGMDISIENKKGSYRSGVDKDGHKWKVLMHYDYGYIRGTVGTDKDHLDCYVGSG